MHTSHIKNWRHFFRMFLDHSPLRSFDLYCGQNALNKNYVWHYGHWLWNYFFFFSWYTLTLGWCIARILSLSRKLFFFACSGFTIWIFVIWKFFCCSGNLELWILLRIFVLIFRDDINVNVILWKCGFIMNFFLTIIFDLSRWNPSNVWMWKQVNYFFLWIYDIFERLCHFEKMFVRHLLTIAFFCYFLCR